MVREDSMVVSTVIIRKDVHRILPMERKRWRYVSSSFSRKRGGHQVCEKLVSNKESDVHIQEGFEAGLS